MTVLGYYFCSVVFVVVVVVIYLILKIHDILVEKRKVYREALDAHILGIHGKASHLQVYENILKQVFYIILIISIYIIIKNLPLLWNTL